ncbi:hypothetical protein SAMN06265373_10365 [Shimia sagamensis]|uniref:Uncharacterized protein n=1 Tax=Shimia sagamensis TaxID=1566352 RepID=A0ABY1NS15_9RHOB|nr:hypothetical protein SAMN06265373_10365 [Shimia sagamensis]
MRHQYFNLSQLHDNLFRLGSLNRHLWSSDAPIIGADQFLGGGTRSPKRTLKWFQKSFGGAGMIPRRRWFLGKHQLTSVISGKVYSPALTLGVGP